MQQNELTGRVILLSICLTILLAAANTFLALKIGMLTSASIPASVLSIAVFRCFRESTILENNLVQTAASAGEAVAGGIVYTVPALIIIGFWYKFNYFENMLIALIGGLLGVVFSVPLRRILVKQPSLPFPEGQAVAQVLKFSQQGSVKKLLLGGLIGAGLELCQTGLKVIANSYEAWFSIKRLLVGFGVGFSATLIGAGYLIGGELALSIMLGGIIGWLIAVPFFSEFYTVFALHYVPYDAVAHLWDAKIRYMGIGAMLFAGLWSFIRMLKPLAENILGAWRRFEKYSSDTNTALPPTDRDMPLVYLLVLASLLSAVMFVFFELHLPLPFLGYHREWLPTITFFLVSYVFIVGFIFSVITGFFSGMVGVSASPGSSVIIGGMLMLGWVLSTVLDNRYGHVLTQEHLKAAEAITIIVGAVITGIAAISNDNIQDLKVGYLVGATPWKQQLMLMLGVVVASLVIPPIMQVLFDVYGIANVMPYPDMDPKQSLPAPPAALMAAITQAVFNHGLPWEMLTAGTIIIAAIISINICLGAMKRTTLSVLGVAIGIYLPMTTSVPLFIGGCFAMLCRYMARRYIVSDQQENALQGGLMLACGLVAGASLMDVLLAIPFALAHSSSLFQVDWLLWHGSSVVFAILSTIGLGLLFVYQLGIKS